MNIIVAFISTLSYGSGGGTYKVFVTLCQRFGGTYKISLVRVLLGYVFSKRCVQSSENSSKSSFLSNRCLLICIRWNNNLILKYKNITTFLYILSTNEPFLWKPGIILGWKVLYVGRGKLVILFISFQGLELQNVFLFLSVGIYLFVSGLICMPNIRFFFLSICQY